MFYLMILSFVFLSAQGCGSSELPLSMKAAGVPTEGEISSLFTYTSSQGLTGQVRIMEDMIVLKDGTKRLGTVKQLPELATLDLKKIHLNVEDVELISCLSDPSELPGQLLVKTYQGGSRIGSAVPSKIGYAPDNKEEVLIDLKEVAFVVLKPRTENVLAKFQQNFLEKIFLAVGEDFDLEEWEKEAQEMLDKSHLKENGEEGIREIEFISKIKEQEDNFEIAYEAKHLRKEYVQYNQDKDLEEEEPVQESNLPFSEESFPEEQNLDEKEAALQEEPPQEDSEQKKEPPSHDLRKNQESDAPKMEPSFKPQRETFVYISLEDRGLPGFYIKPNKVTNREYQRFVKAINYKSPSYWIEGVIPPGLEEASVVNVTYKDAFLYAIWVGKRLPTRSEIEKAADEGVLFDEGDAFSEWTSTPIECREGSLIENSLCQTGSSSFLMHQVVGEEGAIAVPSHESNHRIGFRLAADGY